NQVGSTRRTGRRAEQSVRRSHRQRQCECPAKGCRRLVACELLAQCGELLVGGQGATGFFHCCGRSCVLRLGGVVAGRSLGSCFFRLLATTLDLSGVSLEATLGLGVTSLPSLTLLVELGQPLVGLGVEALREDVV